jgi:DnaK suppressor protein
MVKVSKLGPAFVKKMKTALLEKEKELEKRRTSLAAEDPFAQPGRLMENEPEDDASEQEGHHRVEALMEQLDKLLAQVKKALARMGLGTYGICERCGRPIDKARLKTMPMADLCVECEAKGQK